MNNESRELRNLKINYNQSQPEMLGLIKSTIEVTTLQDVVIYARGNQTLAAELLNVSRCTLRRMLKERRLNLVHICKDGDQFVYTLLK